MKRRNRRKTALPPRRRNEAARELADQRFRPRVVKNAKAYRRRPKHTGREGE